MSDRQPVLYLSHGAPPLADDATWTRELAQWGADLPRPKRILIVSAHWEAAPVALSSTTGAPLLYDFWGFPERYYQVRYDAPAAPDLARDVEALVRQPGVPVHRDESRGLDHGAYVPLKEMYPDADIPVLQMSMPTLDPQQLFALGRRLAPLRDDGTLVVGSGFTTHNLHWFDPSAGADAAPPTPSSEFDAWAAETVAGGDVDALMDFLHRAPAAQEAHPRTEHWAPLYVALGAASEDRVEADSVIDGFWFGLSKRSWQLA
ncbi:class III extradiol ring-cleavage dioxygenase [Luteipulveratus sp. YIM 133132]|uniref:Class III extradiol ring-cleavage dioxygenase n=1 Tax=Luteipulveratus flavus TaxID=3031728 RepID=A0ABT6C905_9MICO|nr:MULTISPECIES: class III extradiol ring-cleavage dioxygenase [unclassified Luteipulveratus]MDE9366939.1 class III extradiol ring-cleavage dioxygenase [Luteipulveratus sp. YIM 133132]MDF8264777.1 class III extradiol ring-cleavage dioxygenase [Luteipulveratus sp. YIM 133296]